MLDKRHKVLVVDDDRVIASTLSAIFESVGYETATAYSGEEAFQVACAFQPDCIVSDVMMGELNGIEAAIEILRELPRCKVVFISGNAPCRDLMGNAIAQGFNFEVLAKPVPMPELLTRIAEICSDSGDPTCCSHMHCRFSTMAKKPGSVSCEGKPHATTYAVCLDCGKEFPCEMKEMKVGAA